MSTHFVLSPVTSKRVRLDLSNHQARNRGADIDVYSPRLGLTWTLSVSQVVYRDNARSHFPARWGAIISPERSLGRIGYRDDNSDDVYCEAIAFTQADAVSDALEHLSTIVQDEQVMFV